MNSAEDNHTQELIALNNLLFSIDKAKSIENALIEIADYFNTIMGPSGCSLHFISNKEEKLNFICYGAIKEDFFINKFANLNPPNKLNCADTFLYENNSNLQIFQTEAAIVSSYCYCPLINDTRSYGVFQIASTQNQSLSNSNIQIIKIVSRELCKLIDSQFFKSEIITTKNNLRNFLNTTKELMLVINLNGFIIDVNETAIAVSGYSLDELKQMHTLSLHDEKHLDQAKRIFTKMIKKEIAFCDIPLKTKSGKEIPVESYIQEGKWNDENVFFAIIRDVSEIKKYQKSLEDASSKLLSLLDNLPYMAWMKDLDGKYIAVNKPFADALKLKNSDIIGRKDIELWYKNNDSVEINLEQKVIETRNPIFQEREYEFEGRKFWFDINIFPIYNGDKIIGATGIAKDVTDRKNIELSIKLSEANLSAIIESSNNSIAAFDKEYNLIAFNQRYAENVYLINSTRVKKGMNYSELTRKNMLEFWKRIYDIALSGEKVQREISYKQSDGFIRFYNISANPVFNNQDIVGFTIFSSDITNIKRKEIELIEAKEIAEKASDAKQMFLSTITHEIRTPLNAIIGLANLISSDDITPELKEKIEMLQFSSNNLYALISDVLDFSKIEAGKIEIEKNNFNLKQFLDNLSKTFNFKANEKGLKFNYFSDNLSLITVNSDQLRINQILVNLLGNSMKFTNEGNVSLKAESYFYHGNEGVKFTIADTGIGISKDKINSIFELFVQADSSIFQRFGGTGLGLSITKKLVELLGGWIEVSSEENKGSTFEVFIPMEKAHESISNINQQSKSSGTLKGMSVLLVEDNEFNQYVAKKFLQKWEIEVDIANDGIECLSKIESEKYHLILMDLQMPRMDGYEATKIIRSKDNSYFNNIPIIALTASAISEVREEALISGMNDFITKPFNAAELHNKLEKYYYLKQ